jgi:COP9 signalosome complex subunit 7
MPQSAILLLAKGVKGASCVKLINDALESQDFFEFTELLTIPNIKELQDTPNFGNAFNQLVAFARSTFRDYPTNLPPLTARQKQKLRILTIARLAQKHCVSIKLMRG